MGLLAMATPPRGPARSRTSSSPVRVLSVPAGIPVTCLFLAGYQGLDTHRKSGETIPCPGREECKECRNRAGIIWKGYAPVHVWDSVSRLWHPFVLELTESLEEELRPRDLVGEVWRLARIGPGHKNDPVTGEFIERREGNKVPAAFDIVPVLLRMYHVSSIRLGRPNSLPPKVCLEAVAGDAPKLPEGEEDTSTPQATEEVRRTMRDMQKEWDEKRRRSQQQTDQGSESNGKHETNGTSKGQR
jgi:hypothetical protein